MREYRLYCLDHEGKGVEARSLTAFTDEEAARQAAALPGLRQCEVWRGNRLIAKVTDFTATCGSSHSTLADSSFAAALAQR